MVCVGRNWNRSKQINPNVPCLNLPRITSSSLDHLGTKRDITSNSDNQCTAQRRVSIALLPKYYFRRGR